MKQKGFVLLLVLLLLGGLSTYFLYTQIRDKSSNETNKQNRMFTPTPTSQVQNKKDGKSPTQTLQKRDGSVTNQQSKSDSTTTSTLTPTPTITTTPATSTTTPTSTPSSSEKSNSKGNKPTGGTIYTGG